ALQQYGFRAIIAPTFADIFFNNSFKNGLLLIKLSEGEVDNLFKLIDANPGFSLTIDLEKCLITNEAFNIKIAFEIDPFRQYCLLNGLDDIGLTLRKADTIKAFEEKHIADQPWLANTIE
ncbi:MAG: 3-isopropylmalate dehydratase small subunit, partial [Oxalobacter sp.]|nr:3-isopropylmalate dehydratase small subunit [Oxalobacter sp.]